MRIINEKIGMYGASFTGYIQDRSDEIPGLMVRPAVLIFPGGAYRICSDREAEPVAMAYLAQGFNAFVLRYTTLAVADNDTEFGIALREAEEALEYIRANAGELMVDPDAIAAAGFSAGGHLVAALGTMGRSRPNALILGYAATTDSLRARGMALPNTVELVDEHTPPTFLFATQGDKLVDAAENSLAFACRLSGAGVPYEVHVYAKGDHGLSLANEAVCGGNGLEDPDVALWLPMSVRFLRQIRSGAPLAVGAGTEPRYSLSTRVEFLLCRPFSSEPTERIFPRIREALRLVPEEASMSIGQWARTHGASDEDIRALEAELARLNER